jgi:hypothetical protein
MELIMDVHPSPEVPVSAMAASDEIVFVTDHNIYRFVVEDPAERRGLLRGGGVSAGQIAYFCGALDGEASFRPSAIRAGARALFLVEEAAYCRRFLTSRVREVRIIKRSQER